MTYEEMLKLTSAHHGRRDDVEHKIQASCVRWFRIKYPKLSHTLFAVPNGGFRGKSTAAKLKEEGVLSGVSDLILLKSNNKYGALLIEMKTATGRQSANQKWWQSLIIQDRYKYVVCRSIDEFMKEVNDYLCI